MKKLFALIFIGLILTVASSCNNNTIDNSNTSFVSSSTETVQLSDYDKAKKDNPNNLIYYEIFVRSFADSDNDGIGDFNGIRENISYFTDLGIEAVWLMPINESPSYHGYDVIDYYETKKDYGTMDEFKEMVNTFNENGIRVMMDLVINHTSDQNEWYLNKDLVNTYYAHDKNGNVIRNFGGGMVDLNLMNDTVKEEICKIAKFYANLGVSGFRLDAVKYFYTVAEYQEVQPSTISYYADLLIMQIKNAVTPICPDVYIVSEVWDNVDFVAPFYEFGTDSCFNFDLQADLISAANGSDYSNYTNKLYNNYKELRKVNPNFIDSPFATNHDLDRIANQINESSEKEDRLKLIPSLLLTLPGTPFIYYGDELGMKGQRVEGENIPGYGVAYDEFRRLPMKLGNNYETSWISDGGLNSDIDYSTLKNNPDSLYNSYKNMINIRKNNVALAFGNDLRRLNDELIGGFVNGYVRTYNKNGIKQNVLVLFNFSSNDKLIKLPYNDIIYSTNSSNNETLKGLSTIIFEISDSEVERITR